MFGSETRVRRPVLLLLVFGAFLAIVGVTATAQGMVVSTHFSTATFESIAGSDAATVRNLANATLLQSDLSTDTDESRIRELETAFQTVVRRGQILRADLRLPDGTIVVSSVAGLTGNRVEPTGDFAAALANEATIRLIEEPDAALGDRRLEAPDVMQEFLPLSIDGRVEAVVAMWRDAGPVLQRLEEVRRDVVVATISAAIVAMILLYLIFRAAQGRITRQTIALLESARRDALTGRLNHGALVGLVATEIEAARTTGAAFGLAVVDIDNFRLLNDTHGHAAGDDALMQVVDLLESNAPAGAIVGRYGPDEFLVMADAATIADLEPAIHRLRDALGDLSLQFDDTERMPITISGGIVSYPLDGGSLTGLLSVLAHTLERAKASGGDEVRVASAEDAQEPGAAGYDILRGLVLAVDTKDRYTKRHSEDVARYATFLAHRIGLDATAIATIERAGIIHDVGKIGIPDAILRKPGRLTADEQEVVKQHVALGEMIVRDVPDLETVRSAIRYHHERWDGAGYLAGLNGEEIPLIARILAVADAFSAMTTTRPYRKALDVTEALRRLGDAAGTQLEERLVLAFIEGIETVPDAPLPGSTVPERIWTPRSKVA